jgi:hypothetical protein
MSLILRDKGDLLQMIREARIVLADVYTDNDVIEMLVNVSDELNTVVMELDMAVVEDADEPDRSNWEF